MSWWMWVAAAVVGANVLFVGTLFIANALNAASRADDDVERELRDCYEAWWDQRDHDVR